MFPLKYPWQGELKASLIFRRFLFLRNNIALTECEDSTTECRNSDMETPKEQVQSVVTSTTNSIGRPVPGLVPQRRILRPN